MNTTKQETLVLPYQSGAIALTQEQAEALFTPDEIEKGEQRGHVKTIGPWQLPVSFTALCTSNTFGRDTYPVEHGPLHVYGKRTMTSVRQSGYELEGRVSVNGKKHRAFTSSQLFELPNGKLISVATIHAVGAAS